MNTKESDDLTTILESAQKKHHYPLFWIILIGFILLGGAGWYFFIKNKNTNGEVTYVTEPLERGDIKLTITATGNLEPTNEVTIGSELSGIIMEVYVDSNDHVTKGEPLAKLDTSKLEQNTNSSRASVVSAKARVAQVQATLKEAEANLARLRELHAISKGKMPSQAELDTAEATTDRAKADLASAEASVSEAEAQLRSNENDLEKAIIKSPIDGIVLSRTVEPGQTVAASFTAPELFVIAEKLEHMKLKVAIAEADIARVKADQTAKFTVDAWPGRHYTAKVIKVAYGSAVVDNVVTYETELEVANDDLSLRPGMTATADISVASSENTFLVPSAALRFEPPKADEDTNAEKQDAPEKKGSFVNSISPMGRWGSMRGRKHGNGMDTEQLEKGAKGTIWVLRDEHSEPEAVAVQIGLNDGARIEVFGKELKENLRVITRANRAAK